MRKILFPLSLAIIIAGTVSCGGGNSFEKDVRKMADYRCKVQQLRAKDPSDEDVKKQLESLEKEMDAYSDKMRDKYENKKDDKAMEETAGKIMKEVMEKCK